MLNLFRKIRQRLLIKNSFTKYLMYLIGETVLVIIGILIALQINEWNDKREKLSKAETYISELKRDLQTDTLIFGNEIRNIDDLIEFKKWGLTEDTFTDVPVSQIEGLFLSQYHNLRINNSTFERIKNSEVFSLVEYEDLFNQVNSYYTFHQDYLNNFNSWEVKMFNNDFNFWFEQNNFEIGFGLAQSDSIFTKQEDSKRRTGIIKTIKSIQGRNHLKMNLIREQVMKSTYQRVYEKASEILLEIEKNNED